MDVRLKLIKANKGDSFILEWLDKCTIIDGGTPRVGKKIRQNLSKSKVLDSIIITHVDNDHIGGIIRLVKNGHLTNKSCSLYINAPEKITVNDGDLVHFGHGKTLSTLLQEKGLTSKTLTASEKIICSDAEFTILTPDLALKNKLIDEWENYIDKNDDGSNDLVCNFPVINVDMADAVNVKMPKIEDDIVNASSISLIFNFKNINILFLSDTHPDLVLKYLNKMDDSKLKFDCVKVSHHGSKFSTNYELMSKLICSKFIISTNGSGPYYHPHKETLQIITQSCINNGLTECTFIFNYEDVKNRINFINLPIDFKVNLEYASYLEF